MKQRNLEKLESVLMSVSDPDSENYGRHLSIEELSELIAPPKEAHDEVIAWLQERVNSLGGSFSRHVQVRRNKVGDYMFVCLPSYMAENIFKVQFSHFSHRSDKTKKVGKTQAILRSKIPYKLPTHLSQYVDSITGLSDFPLLGTKYGRRPTAVEPLRKDPGIDVTPQVLTKLYNVKVRGDNTQKNGQALAEFEQEYFYESDLNLFQQKHGLPVQNVSTIVGVNNPSSGVLGEASLDVQYMMGVSVNVDTWVFSLDIFDLVNWAINVSETPGAPKVHSVSYGSPESEYVPDDVFRSNKEFMKLGALGFSVFVASGDYGTGHTGWISCGKFAPEYPATSPWVTTVGGTYLDPTQNPSEIGVDFSGGGFSSMFARPSYQDDAVKAYLSTPNLPNQKYWNASGRAIPDVSALSTNYQVIIQTYNSPLSGTSAATPVFAGLIALVNDKLVKSGKPVLGFVNPLLYKLKNVGFDITSGNNQDPSCPAGFAATEGWDAVTGLGSPDLDYLLNKIASVLQKN
eukprot:TRINITY_DN55_c0_g1_i1.p1 TRINITY_DN55_c0_g1~~TRINITY_DN55_c0_g1_i1.p1  ORF type:complete len:592 (-),score=168.93 TRINITY_DN55_c0_g1_i1:198-1742(-)